MKTEFGIKSVQAVLDEFEAAFKAVQAGQSPETRKGVFFTSMEAVRNYIERLEAVVLVAARLVEALEAHKDYTEALEKLQVALKKAHPIVGVR